MAPLIWIGAVIMAIGGMFGFVVRIRRARSAASAKAAGSAEAAGRPAEAAGPAEAKGAIA
jgi:hypothetical protein